ncbi:MAG TPA: TRAP transporter small permease subunit [Burkholderiales bacterium]|jgi:TRAP-type mannitol/chloroaromatic compound transport system permease small subunit|nr:TRAP transporter small permease subunit [Burkholderiales bacterium]
MSVTSWLRLSAAVDALNRRVGRYVSWLILGMTAISALNALSRKLLNYSSNAFLEVQWYLFAAVFMLAAGYTLLSNEHVRVDILNTRLRLRARLWIEIIGTVFFLWPFTLLILWYGWPYFVLSYRTGEWSLNAGGLIIWPVKLLIPLGFLLLFLQGVSQFIKLAAALRGRSDPRPLLERHSPLDDEVRAMFGDQRDGGSAR